MSPKPSRHDSRARTPSPQTSPSRTEAAFEALVAAVDDEGGATVRATGERSGAMPVKVAVPGYGPTPGDRVLCVAGPGGCYVTGVLVARSAPATTEVRLDGAVAAVEEGALVIRAADGEVVVTYDPASGATTFRGEARIQLDAAEKLELRAPEVLVEADSISHRAKEIRSEAEHIATSATRWDLRVNRLTERANKVFRDVETVLQVRTGSLRQIARKGMTLFAERTSIRSKKDTSVDGERVLLG